MNYYKIADLYVAMDCETEPTKSRCRPYAVSAVETPDIVIVGKQSEAAARAKEAQSDMTEAEWEYGVYGGYFYHDLIKFGGMMLHSSAVVVDGKAYLFSAHSGTGKSTHTSLWLKLFGECAYIINDDKPALRNIDGKFYVYGTPFSGKHDISRNTRVPLGGICFLSRAAENSICEMDKNDVIFNMMEQTVRRLSLPMMDKMLTTLDLLLKEVKVYKLECNMEDSAAVLSYETMSGERYNG